MKLRTDSVSELLANADAWHEAYYRAETFGGPSLYFHQRALDTRGSPASVQHLEYVYATLASWGMHRMGAGGSKMRAFDAFRDSVGPLTHMILNAQGFEPAQMDEQSALTRLSHCVLTANLGLPHRSIREAIAFAVNLVVHVARAEGTRRVHEIDRVSGYDSDRDKFTLEPVHGHDFGGRKA